ncbi:hypothetical protein [Roseivirga thermotolerans]|uniref:Uncharacterized protein n=1 Tax=Roseivirga thermotolerans TaxID=1758176 RepID=A0ABQ3I512_9BACT|nr:hypothetical protein [Roseivirga thermotolerans]GHE65038.1 hypothetical protein GCM10011340_20080 [Roseivirga thermotolerans]
MKTEISLVCNKCRNASSAELGINEIPEGAARLVTNFCPRCSEGDFGEEWFEDSNGNEISFSETSVKA